MRQPKRINGVRLLLNSSFQNLRLNWKSDGLLELEIGYGHSWKMIEAYIREWVSQEELDLFRQLWSDDNCPRNFQITNQGLQITFLEEQPLLKDS
jgi:hypothetical protein